MSDDSRPHQFPAGCPDGDVIAWRCAACGEVISAFPRGERSPCSVDWRH